MEGGILLRQVIFSLGLEFLVAEVRTLLNAASAAVCVDITPSSDV